MGIVLVLAVLAVFLLWAASLPDDPAGSDKPALRRFPNCCSRLALEETPNFKK